MEGRLRFHNSQLFKNFGLKQLVTWVFKNVENGIIVFTANIIIRKV